MKCDAVRQYGETIGAVHYCGLKKGHKGKHYCDFHEKAFVTKREREKDIYG